METLDATIIAHLTTIANPTNDPLNVNPIIDPLQCSACLPCDAEASDLANAAQAKIQATAKQVEKAKLQKEIDDL